MDQQLPVTADALVESVFHFNRIGNQPNSPGVMFDAAKVCFYTGHQLEELREKIDAIALGCVDARVRELMQMFASIMKSWSEEFKNGLYQGAVLRADREQLLDGDIDLAIVALGGAMYQTPKFREAIGAILAANMAKFPYGVATRNEQGKIMKPAGWVEPNLLPFVDHHGE